MTTTDTIKTLPYTLQLAGLHESLDGSLSMDAVEHGDDEIRVTLTWPCVELDDEGWPVGDYDDGDVAGTISAVAVAAALSALLPGWTVYSRDSGIDESGPDRDASQYWTWVAVRAR